jgi:hypothetical protein
MPTVSASAFKVLMVITRHTLGWGGDNADKAWAIGIGGPLGLRKLTGLSHQGIINGVRELLKYKHPSRQEKPAQQPNPKPVRIEPGFDNRTTS